MVMNNHLCKSLCHAKFVCRSRTSPANVISCFEKHPSLQLFISSVRYISSNATDDQQHSFVVSYLINNCGLSPNSALSASRLVKFDTPKKPDSVLAFLKSQGFSSSNIAKLIRKRPGVLLADPFKSLFPKFNLFRFKGFSDNDIPKIFSSCPNVLCSSIENTLIPSFVVVRDLLPSDELMIYTVKRYPDILIPCNQGTIVHNIELLKEIRVPQSSILWLLKYQPKSLSMAADLFVKIIERVKGMGIKPSSIYFVVAIHGLRAMSESTMETKFNVYKKWGWSKEDTLVAFGKHPWCLMSSEKKITKMMDYYINEMGWDSSFIAKYPVLVSMSLEMRVVPRCAVLQVLLSKGLITIRSPRPLMVSEKSFLSEFVTAFKEQAPHLSKLYEEKLNCANRKEKERKV